LGLAVARILAAEGARVLINARGADGLLAAAEAIERPRGPAVATFAGDLTVDNTPEMLIAAAQSALGGIDILITNTGGPPPGAFADIGVAAWQQAFELVVLSHVRLIRAALPALRQSQAAAVLTVTSYSVKQPIPNLVLSNSLRAATVGLTKSLALELGGEGIRFNSILPGWTETERVGQLMRSRAEANGTTVAAETEKQAAASPLGRMGRPEEFGQAAAFLVSPAAAYITGVMLTVDGGMYQGTL
jgi:3-oxoacyl-[acyl-carrier protein] reductase